MNNNMNNNYNYENDNISIINNLDNSIKLFNCNLCKNSSTILKKKSIYKNSEFICINCWNKFNKRLKEIY